MRHAEFKSISIRQDACLSLWKSCREFGLRGKEAKLLIVESWLAKDVYAPTPRLEPFADLPTLCEYLRGTVGLRIGSTN